ncbi:spaetzle domain-containing protein [Trichonephila clavata]|uniref:Spaetzle domain-containing protein n=1 Tax=Trichonephila clavata TaxID=2740835 RepID=A0A8X6F5D3_TRICU|nr:spaetzle domain-containing protein [Trichonephila clavata]
MVSCEPFDPFFDPGTSFFLPPEETHFGAFPELPFYPKDGPHLSKSPFASETSDLPLYRDGKATEPQATLSKLERNYNAQLHKVASLTPTFQQPRQPFHGSASSSYQGRGPRFQSEPFLAASNVDERKLPAGKYQKNNDGTYSSGSGVLSAQPQIQTGFVPIINGKRTQGVSSSVIKDVAPPILTSDSTRSNTFKVSASVQSFSKVPFSIKPAQNITSDSVQEDSVRGRQASFSRYLRNNTRPQAITPTSSESVVSRVAAKPAAIPKSQDKDILRAAPSIQDDVKTAAKKTLDINCEGSRDLGWCELGDKYPRKYVDQVVAACQDVIQRMHVEVPHSFEKLSDTSDFKAELNSTQREARERGSHDAWSWASYFHEGSLCDAETGFLRPETAKDSAGKWNIIVQTETIRQRVPIEMCRKTNTSCKKMLNCGLKSQCLQKYNYHLLMSLNPSQKHDCPFMKLYRFPSACVCHVD